jgi:hypothetical protein
MLPRYLRDQLHNFRVSVQLAQQHFEAHPDYPSVQVQIFDHISGLKNQVEQVPDTFTLARLDIAIAVFDIRAHAHLRLVNDITAQKEFETLLDYWVKAAWQSYSGYSADEIQPDFTSTAYQDIAERKEHWLTEGYRQLAAKNSLNATPQHGPRQSRRQFIEPLLTKKGLTPSKWASEAGVDPSVVYDYLNEKSNPRPDSRKDLAEVLGLEPSELPE